MSRATLTGLLFLLLLAAGLGLLFGLRVAGLDESALIERAARAYVATGGRAEDCVARPGTGRIWVVVTCGTQGDAFVRAFDRFGFAVSPDTGGGI